MRNHWLLGLMLLASIGLSSGTLAQEFADPSWAYQVWLDGSAVLVDVREDVEIADGMAAPALWIPLSLIETDPDTFARTLSSFTRSRLIFFYCGTGHRAAAATELAIALGYDAENMGAYLAWVEAGLPIRLP